MARQLVASKAVNVCTNAKCGARTDKTKCPACGAPAKKPAPPPEAKKKT